MKIIVPLALVIGLAFLAYVGAAANLQFLFGVVIPYVAFAVFLVGVIIRVVKWAKSPVPFRIPTTCGQQFSLPWIKQNKIENPSTLWGVLVRMALEVFCFRSLFRNLKTEKSGDKVVYGSEKWLWLAGLAFHYSFLIILIRHLRFFLYETPWAIRGIEALDSFFQVGVPLLYITDLVIVAAVTYLFIRRVIIPQVQYISLPADYFPLFLILGIALSGIIMRYFIKVDIVGVKELTLGLVTLKPTVPQGIGSIFYIHVFLVSALFMYFPFSKLMHMGGVFLSPTRNLVNNSRMVRHVNPWNYPVHVHTYEEYEEEFRDKMKQVGIPVEKE